MSKASLYGYSSARVKAMEARLISKDTMQGIINAKDLSTALAILFNTEYKKSISEFGGLGIRTELIDYALSKNFGESVEKLIRISPTTQRKITRSIVAKWALHNVRLALEAKERKIGFDAVAPQIIDFGTYNAAVVKDAFREETVEGMLSKFILNSPYQSILQASLETYRKNKDVLEMIAKIDEGYYGGLENVILQLKNLSYEASMVMKMDIDMQNLLLLLKAKRHGVKYADIAGGIVGRGNLDKRALEQLYNGSNDVESLASQVKTFDLKDALTVYKGGKGKQMILFEIGMRNSIFNSAMRLLRHSILSYGTIFAYIYLKEIEIFTLRIVMKAKFYGLSKEEMLRLLIWKAE